MRASQNGPRRCGKWRFVLHRNNTERVNWYRNQFHAIVYSRLVSWTVTTPCRFHPYMQSQSTATFRKDPAKSANITCAQSSVNNEARHVQLPHYISCNKTCISDDTYFAGTLGILRNSIPKNRITDPRPFRIIPKQRSAILTDLIQYITIYSVGRNSYNISNTSNLKNEVLLPLVWGGCTK